MPSQPPIHCLMDRGDTRGSSFSLPAECLRFLRGLSEMHVADIRPGAVRGNHFHEHHREVLCVRHRDTWSFHWDSGPETPVQSRTFDGSGLVVVEIEPFVAHALRNDGRHDLNMVAFSDVEADLPDTRRRQIV